MTRLLCASVLRNDLGPALTVLQLCSAGIRTTNIASCLNASRDEHMIAISAALGLAVLDRWLSLEIEMARVLALPSSMRSVIEPAGANILTKP